MRSAACGLPATLGANSVTARLCGVPQWRSKLSNRRCHCSSFHPNRKSARPGALGVGAVQDEGGGARRVGRGVEQRHRPALGDPEQRRALGPDLVQDRLHVVHALLEREDLRAAVGHAGAALVEQDHAAERGEPPEECDVRGRLPGRLDVGDESRNEQQIARTLAEHLIGDMNVVALDVAGGGEVGHREPVRDAGAAAGGRYNTRCGMWRGGPARPSQYQSIFRKSGHRFSVRKCDQCNTWSMFSFR